MPEPCRELQGLRERETGRFLGSTVAQRAGARYMSRRHSLAGQMFRAAAELRKCHRGVFVFGTGLLSVLNVKPFRRCCALV